VRALYQSGGPMGLTATILQSGSLDDALMRWHAVENIVQADTQHTAADQAVVQQRAREAAAAGQNRAVLVARQAAADKASAAVTQAIARQRDLIARTDARVVQLAEQQRQAAEAAALAAAQQSAASLGIGDVDGVGGGSAPAVTAASTTQLPDVPAPNGIAATAIAAAATRLGMPYVWGAAGPTSFDCSGLMQWSYAQAGLQLPRTSRAQYAVLPHVPLNDLQPGDLVFYATDVSNPATIHHVGMYVGEGLSLYAPETGSSVKIGPVGYGRIIGAARPSLAA